MASEVATSHLNYTDVKSKALNSKLIRTITPSSNGTSFTMGQTVNIDLQSNTPLYLDAHATYIKMKITNNNASYAITFDGDANSVINRMLLQSSGQTFCDVLSYNLLVRTLKTMSVGGNYNNNVGRILMGSAYNNEAYAGIAIGATDSITVCLPLSAIPLAMTTPARYIYCGARSPFQFKITLADVAEAFYSTNVVNNSEVAVEEVELIASYVQLSGEAQSQVNSMVGGKYNVLCSEFSTFSTTLSAGVTALSFPLGVSRSSLDRIIVVHRLSANATAYNKFSLSARDTAGITSSRLNIAGQSFPNRRIEREETTTGKYVQFLAELLVSNHDLPNQDHLSSFFNGNATDLYSLANGAGNSSVTIGTFVYGIELESLAYNSEKVFSGVNTIGQSVFLENYYDGTAGAMTVTVFCQSTVLLSLDMNGSGVYSISV